MEDGVKTPSSFFISLGPIPEACFGFAGVENEGWKVNISTSSTMCLC